MSHSQHARVRDVRKVAVFRPSAIGDFMFCLPALHALKASYPDAELVYVGKKWHAQFLAGRPGPVDRVIVAPALAGIGPAAPGTSAAGAAVFADAMRAERFDVALQMFGGGRHANAVLRQWDARLTVGMRTPDAPPLDRCLPYADLVNRRLQLLELVGLVGASSAAHHTALQVTQADRRAAALAFPASAKPLVVLQPGASDTRRRWPVDRFATLADALAEEGAEVMVNGSADEALLVSGVLGGMRHASEAAGTGAGLSLSALCGLMERAALVVSNDTGPLHLALALGRPCVGIYWLTNLLESAPLVQQWHRAAVATRVHCPVCGVENLTQRCPHNASFVADVALGDVASLAIDLYRRSLEAMPARA